ncbi:MAG TPA: ATP-binding protein [Kofleriaceae bacterium]
MSPTIRSRLEPFAIAGIAVAAGVLMRMPLEPFLSGTQVWLTFWPAVFLASWFGGARAGITAVLMTLVVVYSWLLPDMPHSVVLTPTRAIIGASVFVVCGFGFAYVAEVTRRSRDEERRSRRAAEVARREAIEANRAKDEFLAVLGHELRNPLAPVASAAGLLRMRVPESRELDVIDRQVRHMSRLVDDLLDISRIVRGRVELQRTVNDLAALVEKAAEMVMPQRERTGHRFEIDVPLGIFVDVDAARIVQVLTNVLVNALKYSGPDQAIKIAAQRSGERAVVTIADHGVGMDDMMLARAFEPFVQGAQDIDRSDGGLGLGLAIARRLVELHAGTLTATSKVGVGTTVEMTLAVTRATPASVAVEAPAKATGQRILVVDDNEDGAQMLADLLATRGHVVKVAYDGPTALEVLRTFVPTLALVDIGLPGMDGHELCRHMRDRKVAARLIAVTGYGRESDRERALEAGFDDHVVKPLSVSRLDELIRGIA